MCLWDGVRTSSLPLVPGGTLSGGNSRYFYYWSNRDRNPAPQVLMQYDRVEDRTRAMPLECKKNPTNGQFEGYVRQTDTSGLRLQFGCGTSYGVFDSQTGEAVMIPSEAVLNSTFTRALSRPSPEEFLWIPLGMAFRQPLHWNYIEVGSFPRQLGVLSYLGRPDFTLAWGGQELKWIGGEFGYSYAPLPRDLVPGAEDAVVITSHARPWLNGTVTVKVSAGVPRHLPVVAGNAGIQFIRADHGEFISETKPARHGDLVHFLVDGIDPAEVESWTKLRAVYFYPSGSLNVDLPIVAISATEYHPSIVQVTVRIPEDAPELGPVTPVSAGYYAQFSLRNQSIAEFTGFGVLWYQ
jgi:hypothetical protein